MPFDLDSIYVFYALAAASAVLFVEATYMLLFSTASYRSRINRRLRLAQDQPDRESVLVQLRRERGLTADGLYALPSIALNRLILQSGVTIGVRKFLLLDAAIAIVVFGATMVVRASVLEAVAATLCGGLLLPWFSLRFL